jgi:hypothetical protein
VLPPGAGAAGATLSVGAAGAALLVGAASAVPFTIVTAALGTTVIDALGATDAVDEAPGPLYLGVRHHTLPIVLGFKPIDAALATVKTSDPRTLPSASWNAWQEMAAESGPLETDWMRRPQMEDPSGYIC